MTFFFSVIEPQLNCLLLRLNNLVFALPFLLGSISCFPKDFFFYRNFSSLPGCFIALFGKGFFFPALSS